MTIPLTTRIPVKDRDGRVVDEKEVATFAGLLSRAHDEGLKRVDTTLLQIPTPDNGMTAIVRAVVETDRGTFSGLGDASPDNVNRRIAPHIIRQAETRAKARAFRDAVNIGTVALDELGDFHTELDEDGDDITRLPPPKSGGPAMTDGQRRYLYRLMVESGVEHEQTDVVLLDAAQVDDPSEITKRMASALIDEWKEHGVPRAA